ncbi:MAG: DUF1573 domain-containing protein [candidate division Zixibacteria bacterium]|nr:DUF1573 domain-containing protein [candidate division Zixibacteria bacterium]
MRFFNIGTSFFIMILMAFTICVSNLALADSETGWPDLDTKVSPIIHFPEETYDFGDLTQDTTVFHVFKVQNVGNAPLKLIKAKGS